MIKRYLGLYASSALVGVVKHISPTKVDQGTAVVGPLYFLPSLLDAQHPSNGASWRAAHSTEGPARVRPWVFHQDCFACALFGDADRPHIGSDNCTAGSNQQSSDISHCVKCSA